MTSRTLGSVYAKRFNLLYNLKENNFYTYIGIKYNTVYFVLVSLQNRPLTLDQIALLFVMCTCKVTEKNGLLV